MAKILVIDDDQATNRLMKGIVTRLEHTASSALTLGEGLDKAESESFDVIFLDVHLPDGNGLEAIPVFRKIASSPEIIIITGYGDPDGAELAIRNGAWDYIQKPSSVDKISLSLIRALEYRTEKNARSAPVLLDRHGIIGSGSEINSALQRLAQAAETAANVLVIGETGTGKELFARAIHKNSARANRRFVVVDCAALPESLIESILFGHRKGAFTGAEKTRQGLIQQADGGTLFLDEVGELPPAVQKTFLRVLQERQFLPVGAKKEIRVDFRLISATNRNLDKMTESNQFRQDLLFRLRSFSIDLPPLRARKGDIRELVMHYTHKLCDLYGTEIKGFAPEFFKALEVYPWPGNIRELFNALEEALSVARYEPTLFPHHLPTHIRAKVARQSIRNRSVPAEDPFSGFLPEDNSPDKFPDFKKFRDMLEVMYLKKLMLVTQNTKKEACRVSGISRTRLFELLKKHSIE